LEELFTSYQNIGWERRGSLERLDEAMKGDPSLRVLLAMARGFPRSGSSYEDLVPEQFRTRLPAGAAPPGCARAAVEKRSKEQ